MSGLLNKTLHYGRLERITIRLTGNGLKTLLEQAGEIPAGFLIDSCDLDADSEIEIVLKREIADGLAPSAGDQHG